MEENQVRTLNIKGLPKRAVGVHTVKKVLILEDKKETAGEIRQTQMSYALVLLDNQATFRINQRYYYIAGPLTICRCFSRDEHLLIMGEGKTFNLKSF